MTLKLLRKNFITAQDTYKYAHFLQLPPEAKFTQSVITPRKGNGLTDQLVVAGTRQLAYELATTRISVTDVEEAVIESEDSGTEFNYRGWMDIASGRHGLAPGVLPIRLRALPEGTVVKPGTAMAMIENVVSGFGWLPSFLETTSQRYVWKASTAATLCRYVYTLLEAYAEQTGASKDMLFWKFHNFGDRGADSYDAAITAALGHALVFTGSDCAGINRTLKHLYQDAHPMTSSVEATEHSTMCMNSDAEAKDDWGAAVMAVSRLEKVVRRVEEKGIGIPLMSAVIDTYDSHRFIQYLASEELAPRIKASGGRFIARPDSGDPTIEPFDVLDLLGQAFGTTLNAKGFKELPAYLGVLQGDGISPRSLQPILEAMVKRGWSLDAIGFGCGGGITHEAGRDEFSFSQKTTAYSEDGEHWVAVKKDPITDRAKASLSGYIYNTQTEDGIISESVTHKSRLQGVLHTTDQVEFDPLQPESLPVRSFAVARARVWEK